MIKLLPLSYLLFLIVFISCDKNNRTEDTTYFGGEIINPKENYVLLFKDDVLIDSITLDNKNRFLYKFNNFKSGLYHFNHQEYQYVYIEPKDSIVFRLNTIDFDESLTFSGKGAHKNNFIINTFLANERHEAKAYRLYKLPPEKFSTLVSGELTQRLNMLELYKERYSFSNKFNEIANAHITYYFYALNERYPRYNRKYRDSINPQKFYKFRENLDLNTGKLGSFYPFYEYLYSLIDNLSLQKLQYSKKNESSLTTYTTKTEVIDSLIQNEGLKNQLLKNTTLYYLTKINSKTKAEKFLTVFNKFNTNKQYEEKINNLVNSIKRLSAGKYIPNFNVINTNNETVAFKSTLNKPTVIYFWSTSNPRHLKSVHKKVAVFSNNSEYDFVGISLDNNKNNWKTITKQINLDNDLLLANPRDIKETLLIRNLNKVYVLDKNAKILNSELNIFNPHFNDKLNSLR